MYQRSMEEHGALTWSVCAMVAFLFVTSCASSERGSSNTTTGDREKQMFVLIDAASKYTENGKYADAIHAYEEAIQLKPNASDLSESKARRWAQNNLAWLLATCRQESVRDGPRAVGLAQQLVAIYPRDVAYLDSLAAAYAEVGRFEDAVRTAQEAVNNIPRNVPKDKPEVVQFKEHLDAYRNHRPWREP